MHFSETFTTIGSKIWKAVLFICVVQLASASQCFSSVNVNCDCDSAKVECSGIQTNISEVQDILANFTLMTNVIMEIDKLEFEPDFKLGKNMSIINLTLGYGLQNLPSEFFLEMGTSLISLNLQNNSMKLIDDKLFSTLTNLNELFLDMNELNELESSMFANLINLKYLSIASNDFHEIAPDTFQTLSSLHTLVVSHNNLSLFQNVNIKSSYLSVLRLEGCGIQGGLEKDTFSDVPNLEKLDLAYNRLSEVKPNSLSALKNLKYLNLSHNVIGSLQENAFNELCNLTHLDLKGNRISIIKTTSFTNLLDLEYLDLSRNRLEAFLCEYTTDFAQLKTINLQDNEIKSFTTGAFYYSPLLQKLDITGNDLECSCDLTDISFYLIHNSTMKKDDLDSVSCISPSTGRNVSVIGYDISKCPPEEPCEKLNYNPLDYYDDDGDYLDATGYTATGETSSTTPITNHTTFVAFTTATSTNMSTRATTDSTITSSETTTDSTISYSETTADSTIESAQTTEDSTITSSKTTTIPPITSTISTTTSTASPTLANGTAASTALFNTIPSTSIVSTDTPTDSPVTSTTAETFVITSSTSDSGSFSDPETTIVLLTTVENITTTTEVTNLTDPITVSVPNDNLTTLYSITDSVSNRASETSTVVETTTVVYSTTKRDTLNETISTTLPATSSVTYTTKSPTTSEKISTAVISTPKQSCSSLELSLESLTSDPDIIVIRNFSYDDNTFCLKWTIGGSVPPKIRCILKYIFIKGTKSENIKCPSVPGEVKLWTKNEKIFKFCLDIHVPEKISSCKDVSAKTTPKTFDQATTSNVTYLKTDISSKITTFSTDRYTETSTSTSVSTIISSSVSIDKTELKTDPATTKFTPTISPTLFNITSFDVFFNDSSFAYVKWTVSKEEPLNLCSLTLTATTQYFDYEEGAFPCKKHTHQLQSVKEGEIFKACLVSHDSSGYGKICRYSLTGANFDAEASKSKDHATSNNNSSLIPLICLLILLVIIMIFIIFKNMYRKKIESDRYDVRAEEEKSQRVEARPASSHDRSSVRYSYIAKENPDV